MDSLDLDDELDILDPHAQLNSFVLENLPGLVLHNLLEPEARMLETQCALQALQAAYEQAVSVHFDTTKAQQLCTELQAWAQPSCFHRPNLLKLMARRAIYQSA